jgi:CRP/FNR family cyclic AMP-dependent transcriptional regulator
VQDWWLLRHLEPADRDTLLSATQRRHYRRDEIVFHEGDPGDTMHLVESGRLLVRVSTPRGETTTLTVLGPGDTFGELALLRNERERSATVVAIEQAQTLALHRRDFDALRASNAAINKVLVVTLADTVDRLNHRLLEASYVSVECRIARALIQVAPTYQDRAGEAVIRLTQEDLAGLVSATRPTVNRALQHLADAGAITISRGKIVVADMSLLEKRADVW